MPRRRCWGMVGAGERVKRASMRERIALLGSELKIKVKAELGTLLLAEVPLLAPAEVTKGTAHAGP